MSKNFSFILEAGVNHDGNRELAERLISSAAETGADYIKFQTYTSDKIAAKHSPSYWDLSEEETTSQRELFSKYDRFTTKDYFELARLAEQSGIGFMTTCFDTDWVDALDSIIPQYKIASADITNFSLIAHVAKKNKPMILSTGAASLNEVKAAVNVVRKLNTQKLSLMHCVLNYPTKAENASLSRIASLVQEFPNIEIGYSDHTKPVDSFEAITVAYALGSRVFEKHFTWNKAGVGNDHYHSFDLDDAKLAISSLIKVDKLLKFNEHDFLDVQHSARSFARRGIYAARTIKVGEILRESDLIPLRPPIGDEGFNGDEIEFILGKTALVAIENGDPIRKNSIH